MGFKHNSQNDCRTDKRIHVNVGNYDEESLNRSQTSYGKSTNNSNNSDPMTKKKKGKMVELQGELKMI